MIVAPRVALLMRWVVRVAALAVVAFAVVRLAEVSIGPLPTAAALAFTPYVLGGALALVGVALWLREHHALGAASISALVLAAVVVPRSVAAPQPPAAGPAITITTANLSHGNADPAALARLIERRQTDVLALQELNPAAMRALRRAGVFDRLSATELGPGRRQADVGVASRWPVRLLDADLPTVYRPTAVDVPGHGELPVVSAHPYPPLGAGAQRRWRGWLRVLPGPQEGVLRGGVLVGDFNATLDHPEMLRLLDAGWRTAARERGAGLQPTWHGLPLARLTIDHILVPPGVAVERYVTDPLPGSDHRAVTAVVRLPAR